MRLQLRIALILSLVRTLLAIGLFESVPTSVQQFTFDVSVVWVNDAANPEDCDDAETTFVETKIQPDLNLILSKNGFEPIEWDFTRSPPSGTRHLYEDHERALGLCDMCFHYFPNSYCNALYNCGVRRLRVSQRNVETSPDVVSYEIRFTKVCDHELILLSESPMLSEKCRNALMGSSCMAIFL